MVSQKASELIGHNSSRPNRTAHTWRYITLHGLVYTFSTYFVNLYNSFYFRSSPNFNSCGRQRFIFETCRAFLASVGYKTMNTALKLDHKNLQKSAA